MPSLEELIGILVVVDLSRDLVRPEAGESGDPADPFRDRRHSHRRGALLRFHEVIHLSDRKYRHRGYQDSGGYSSNSSSTPRTPRTTSRAAASAPRRSAARRTAGGFGPEVFKCNQAAARQPTFDETCVKCGADLHTCGNCRFFDTTTMWECRENIPARVSRKHARNECTFFQPKVVRDLTADKDRQPQTPDDARKAFDALFKK